MLCVFVIHSTIRQNNMSLAKRHVSSFDTCPIVMRNLPNGASIHDLSQLDTWPFAS